MNEAKIIQFADTPNEREVDAYPLTEFEIKMIVEYARFAMILGFFCGVFAVAAIAAFVGMNADKGGFTVGLYATLASIASGCFALRFVLLLQRMVNTVIAESTPKTR